MPNPTPTVNLVCPSCGLLKDDLNGATDIPLKRAAKVADNHFFTPGPNANPEGNHDAKWVM